MSVPVWMPVCGQVGGYVLCVYGQHLNHRISNQSMVEMSSAFNHSAIKIHGLGD